MAEYTKNRAAGGASRLRARMNRLRHPRFARPVSPPPQLADDRNRARLGVCPVSPPPRSTRRTSPDAVPPTFVQTLSLRASRVSPIAAVVLAIGLVAASVAALAGGHKGKGAMKPPAPPVVVAEVTRDRLQAQLWHSGSIESRDEAALSAESDGRMVLIAEVGDRLAPGAPVARLDDTLLSQDWSVQLAEIESQKARIRFLERETGRLAKLTKSNNAALSLYEERRSEWEVAKAALAAARAHAARAEELVRRMTIAAPFAGVVKTRAVEVGEWVKQGDMVASFVGTGRLEVRVGVPAKALAYIARGETLTVNVEGRKNPAVVRAIVPAASGETRLFDLRLDIAATAALPGQLVRVGVPVGTARDALLVPEDALVIRESGIGVFVVGDDMVARRVDVQTGLSSDARIEVFGNLREGQKVVIRGGERLRAGTAVRFIDAGMPGMPAKAPTGAPEGSSKSSRWPRNPQGQQDRQGQQGRQGADASPAAPTSAPPSGRPASRPASATPPTSPDSSATPETPAPSKPAKAS